MSGTFRSPTYGIFTSATRTGFVSPSPLFANNVTTNTIRPTKNKALKRLIAFLTLSETSPESKNCHEFLHRIRRLLQRRIFLRRQFNLNDFFHSLDAQLHRYANKQSFNSVLAFEIHRARQNLLLALQNRLDHFHSCRPWGVVPRPGLQ